MKNHYYNKLLNSFLLLITFSVKLNAQQPAFTHYFSYPNSIIKTSKSFSTSDNGFILCNVTKDTLTNLTHLNLAKLNSIGTILWQKTYFSDSILNLINLLENVSANEYFIFKSAIYNTNYNDSIKLLKINLNGDSVRLVNLNLMASRAFKINDNKYKIIGDSVYTIDSIGTVSFQIKIPQYLPTPPSTWLTARYPINVINDTLYEYSGTFNGSPSSTSYEYVGYSDSLFIAPYAFQFTTSSGSITPPDLIVLDSSRYILNNVYPYFFFFTFYDLNSQFNFSHSFPTPINNSHQLVSKACGNGFVAYQESDHTVFPYEERFHYFDYFGNNLWSKILYSSLNTFQYPSNLSGSDNIILLGRGFGINYTKGGLDSIMFEGYSCNALATSIHDINYDLYLFVAPNPTNSFTTITAPSFSNSTLSLYDLTGRILIQQKFNEQATINVSALKEGMYVVEVRDEKGMSAKGKLIKN